MECYNSECEKSGLLTSIFASINTADNPLKFCPFCNSPLGSSTFEKPTEDENKTSKATEEATEPYDHQNAEGKDSKSH
jgi:hypothetical protein